MADKINSFTKTVEDLTQSVNVALNFAVSTNESLVTQNDSVTMEIEEVNSVTGDSSTVSYSIPSYNTMINKVNNAVETVGTFTKGEGKVLLNDGTYREVITKPVAISPAKISDLGTPSKFDTKYNWFFESMMFPQLTVEFDLKNQIDDRSDRVSVRRVIFDNFDDTETEWFKTNVIGKRFTYYDLITYYNANSKKYWHDDEVKDLSLFTEPYTGYFVISDIQTIDGKQWHYLDTTNYGVPSDDPILYNLELAKGNKLRYNNSIYIIDDINVAEKRVQLVSLIGMDHPARSKQFEIYSEPFSEKILTIPVGYDECNVIFVKGINDDYNLLADEWSEGAAFYTNDLSAVDSSTTLEEYYNSYVADFGKQLEGEAKEKFIPAYYGLTPDAPTLNSDSFIVNQINTQLNASLDTDEIKNSQTSIETTKTLINSLKSTIAQQKAELVTTSEQSKRNDLNSKISNNITDLDKRTIEYQSLVRALSTLAYESDAVNAPPKYRLRGFFTIPTGKKQVDSATTQEIIQFEVAHRYLKLDNSGTELKTYTNTNSTSGNTERGVFSDWVITPSAIKEREYDSSLGRYTWVSPSIADGDTININQIDIPLRTGEKVEFKIRSISEAGWPKNPIKSGWSDSIIKEFPANLVGSDQVTNILTDAVSEENTIKLEQTLSASGVTSHIADSIPNPNAGDGTYFKHQAVNLSYDLSKKDSTGLVSETSAVDLQSQLGNLPANTYITISSPPGATNTNPQLTGTLQQLLQAMVNADPTIFDEFGTILA